jgi:Lrp/AsnC family leucine-responsive transcriptional regulator
MGSNLTKFENEPLDRTDALLVEALQRDAKQSLADLGEVVGLSAPAVHERVRKLEQRGIIRGYHALLDAKAVGLDITAFVGVGVRDPACISGVEAWVVERPEILECHHITGNYTLLIKAKVKNTSALEALINSIRAREGVTGTDTMVVFSTSVERIPVALDVPAADPAARRRGRPRKKAS